jgi:hypothetical protein
MVSPELVPELPELPKYGVPGTPLMKIIRPNTYQAPVRQGQNNPANEED